MTLNFVQQKEVKPTCVIDDQCSATGCCINRECVEASLCFEVFTRPLLTGISCGLGLFLITFATIFTVSECRKPKNIFREERTAEDVLFKKEFPKPTKEKVDQFKNEIIKAI